jgi:hypothetical protein
MARAIEKRKDLSFHEFRAVVYAPCIGNFDVELTLPVFRDERQTYELRGGLAVSCVLGI